MLKLIGILLVSPSWGIVSTRLFLQAWLAFANLLITAIGFIRGRVERKNTALGMGVALASGLLSCGLLRGGYWLLTDILMFGWSTAENTVYWIFAGLSLLFFLPRVPAKIRKAWRNAMIPGSLEEDILNRKLREESEQALSGGASGNT